MPGNRWEILRDGGPCPLALLNIVIFTNTSRQRYTDHTTHQAEFERIMTDCWSTWEVRSIWNMWFKIMTFQSFDIINITLLPLWVDLVSSPESRKPLCWKNVCRVSKIILKVGLGSTAGPCYVDRALLCATIVHLQFPFEWCALAFVHKILSSSTLSTDSRLGGSGSHLVP